MITEDYVSFEVAKLLKEKGFDLHDTKELYVAYKDGYHVINNPHTKDYPTNEFPKATHQMARKWIRLKYKIHIRIFEDTLGTVYEWQIYKDGICQKHSFIEDSYEKALETAIKYCLINII